MTTATKTKNGNVSAETVVDMTNKMTEDARVLTDTVVKTADRFTEEARTVFSAQQKMFQDSLNLYVEFSQSYLDLTAKIAEQNMTQWLTFRERVGKLTEDNVKKTNELLVAEQAFAFETVEAVQAQTQAVAERFSKFFTPVTFK
jgi:hypothetical protein